MRIFLAVLLFITLQKTGSANICRSPINDAEKAIHAPKDLLYSLAIVESGRLNRQSNKVEPYPWAINVNGKDIFYPTKEAAIAGVKKLQKSGHKSIDVGCMQINLHHHKKAFRNLDDAFDPEKNVAYAAKFMGQLRKDLKSWSRAVAYYHSRTPKHHIKYQKKVYHTWNEEKRKAYKTYYANLKLKKQSQRNTLKQGVQKKFPAFPNQAHKKTKARVYSA